MASGQPPVTRARAGSSRAAETGDEGTSVERLVEAVIVRLTETGLMTPAAPTAASAAAWAAPAVVKEEHDFGGIPPPTLREMWLEELRRQQVTSSFYGVREKEETRALLIIGEGAGPPPEHQAWYWGRVRLFLIVARHGWAAAVRDSRFADLDQLGIRLSPAAVAPPPAAARAPAAVAPPGGWRGRPSRPSGLRPPPSGGLAAAASAARRKD